MTFGKEVRHCDPWTGPAFRATGSRFPTNLGRSQFDKGLQRRADCPTGIRHDSSKKTPVAPQSRTSCLEAKTPRPGLAPGGVAVDLHPPKVRFFVTRADRPPTTRGRANRKFVHPPPGDWRKLVAVVENSCRPGKTRASWPLRSSFLPEKKKKKKRSNSFRAGVHFDHPWTWFRR